MAIIEKLSWYDDYSLILEGRRIAAKGIEDLENPEKQLQRIKKFYKNLGADYTKNNWLMQVEEDIFATNRGEDSHLSKLKRDVKIGNVIENAIQKQDEESIRALNVFMDDELYKPLIKGIMFYIGVSMTKKDPEYIKKAYDAIYRKYTLEQVGLFVEEGVYYYIYYFQCLQELLKKNKGREKYYYICPQIKDRCYNAKLMLGSYLDDIYLVDEVKMILAEISLVEELMDDEIY